MSIWIALIPVSFLFITLSIVILVYDQTPHIPLIFTAALAAAVAYARKTPWKTIHNGIVHGISLGMGAILILMIVGTMIGTWILGGIVPAMIYYGLKIFSPGYFLVATMLICSVVALGTGSSWSTIGTVGVALVGVGHGLGVPLPMVAGAIVSGAYFGDKMSPLSDTTNLAPAIAGTDLFTHIRHMLYTTIPSYLFAGVLYVLLGRRFAGNGSDTTQLDLMLTTLKDQFTIHPTLLLAPVLVILLAVRRVPPLPAILGGTVLGGLFALFVQHSPLPTVIEAAYTGYVSQTNVASVDALLSRGGTGPPSQKPVPLSRRRRHLDISPNPLEQLRCLYHSCSGCQSVSISTLCLSKSCESVIINLLRLHRDYYGKDTPIIRRT